MITCEATSVPITLINQPLYPRSPRTRFDQKVNSLHGRAIAFLPVIVVYIYVSLGTKAICACNCGANSQSRLMRLPPGGVGCVCVYMCVCVCVGLVAPPWVFQLMITLQPTKTETQRVETNRNHQPYNIKKYTQSTLAVNWLALTSCWLCDSRKITKSHRIQSLRALVDTHTHLINVWKRRAR